MMTSNIERVRAFCAAFADKDPEQLLTFFTDAAVYHNMPMAPVSGKAAIKSVLEMFLKPASSVEFVILHAAECGDTVMTERIDRFVIGDRVIELPIAGVFEMKDGKITAWRDYFDLATWAKQNAAS
jgi:limonene-1,2-epoxide hydrolase